jgi:hypothetical protein
MIKATLRIPTEQYAFMEVEIEVADLKEAREKYLELQNSIIGGGGLEVKEWNSALDKYLSTNSLTESEYMMMSSPQQHIIQEIKKSVKRINKDENNNS